MHFIKHYVWGIALLSVVNIGVDVARVYGAPFKISPILSLNQTYNDNILFQKSDGQEDYITTVAGDMRLTRQDTRVNAMAVVRLEKVLYHQYSEYNSLDQLIKANVNYRLTERLTLGTQGEYFKDSQIDRLVDTTGLVVMGDRTGYDVSVSGKYLCSETVASEWTAGFGNKEVRSPYDMEENQNVTLSLSFSKDLSKTFKQTTGTVGLRYYGFDSDQQTQDADGVFTREWFKAYDSDVIQLYSGFSKQITELYTIYLQAGISFLDTHETGHLVTRLPATNDVVSWAALAPQSSDSLGGVLYAGVNYQGETSNTMLSISHDIREGSGTNGAVERTSFAMDWSKKVTSELDILFGSSFHMNKNHRQNAVGFDEHTYNAQIGFGYKFSRDWKLTGMFRTVYIKDQSADSSSRRNIVYVQLTKTFDALNQ